MGLRHPVLLNVRYEMTTVFEMAIVLTAENFNQVPCLAGAGWYVPVRFRMPIQHVPDNTKLETIIGIQNRILNGRSSCFFSNEPFEKRLVRIIRNSYLHFDPPFRVPSFREQAAVDIFKSQLATKHAI